MMIEICREFGRSPSWWLGLRAEDRVLLLAERRVRATK